jgi:hypothetical protein
MELASEKILIILRYGWRRNVLNFHILPGLALEGTFSLSLYSLKEEVLVTLFKNECRPFLSIIADSAKHLFFLCSQAFLRSGGWVLLNLGVTRICGDSLLLPDSMAKLELKFWILLLCICSYWFRFLRSVESWQMEGLAILQFNRCVKFELALDF